MLINLQKLLKLPVFTESGEKLGKIYDCELDVDTHNVLRYIVRQNILSPKNLLIQNSQIKSISDEKVVVYDGLVKNLEKVGEPAVPEE